MIWYERRELKHKPRCQWWSLLFRSSEYKEITDLRTLGWPIQINWTFLNILKSRIIRYLVQFLSTWPARTIMPTCWVILDCSSKDSTERSTEKYGLKCHLCADSVPFFQLKWEHKTRYQWQQSYIFRSSEYKEITDLQTLGWPIQINCTFFLTFWRAV